MDGLTDEEIVRQRFEYKNPDIIKLEVPFNEENISEYYDIIDWASVDVRKLKNIKESIVDLALEEGFLNTRYFADLMLDWMFINYSPEKAEFKLFNKSMNYYGESYSNSGGYYMMQKLHRFIMKFCNKQEYSSCIVSCLKAIKLKHGATDLESMAVVTYHEALKNNITEVLGWIDEQKFDFIKKPEDDSESQSEFEERIRLELQGQADAIRAGGYEVPMNWVRFHGEHNIREQNKKKFWKYTGIMALFNIIIIPALLAAVIGIFFGYSIEQSGVLKEFVFSRFISTIFFATLGFFIFKHSWDLKKLSMLYKYWVIIGSVTGLITSIWL